MQDEEKLEESSAASPNETPEEKFKRIANLRVPNAIKKIKLILLIQKRVTRKNSYSRFGTIIFKKIIFIIGFLIPKRRHLLCLLI